MKNVYACLAGKWVRLNDDADCSMGIHRTSPSIWYEENAEIFAPFKRDKENTYYQMDYVHIYYQHKDYRINPIFIQIVEE